LAKKNPGRRKLPGIFFLSVLVLRFFWADFSLKTTRFSVKEKKLLKLRQSAEIGTAIIRVINAGKIHLAFEKVGSLKQS
jgi:hypothetical protein